MAQKAKAQTPARQAKLTRDGAAGGMMTMLMVNGDPAAALKGVSLPSDARVAIVSPNPEAVQKIKHSGKTRFGAVCRIYAGAAPAAVDKSAFEPDARSLALIEGVRIAHEGLRAAGGAYDIDQVRALLRGISRQAIDKRVQEGSLLALPGPNNRRSFPTLQFNRDGAVVQGLKEVREALSTRNPWTIFNFLAYPDDRLNGRKPIEALKAGEVALVVEAARRMAQQGA
jgi:hypothetical protein